MPTDARRETLDRVLRQRQPDLTVLAERLHKPRNFSAVIRTCDAVGIGEVHAVLPEGRPTRHWHTSQGAEKWVRVRTHASTSDAVDVLRAKGLQLVAAHLSKDAVDYREVDYTRPTALLVGTEAFGVSEHALEFADHRVMIPMLGMAQSLNVSVACALVLYEAQRQRATAGLYAQRRLSDHEWKRLRFEWLHPKLAAFCRERGVDYPELDEEGELLGEVPRG